MAVTPSDEDISNAMNFSGFYDREMIIRALIGRGNNVGAVVNEYLDSPNKFKSTWGWDEAAFSAGREDNDPRARRSNAVSPSFNIHPPDDRPEIEQVLYGSDPNSFYGPAPSRPPSRADSPLFSDPPAANHTSNAPRNKQEEDAQTQLAISNSLGDAGIQGGTAALPSSPPLFAPQQSGVTPAGNGGVQFGPANQSEYDPNEWAMVRADSRNADPPPGKRAKKDSIPVFLRNRPSCVAHRAGGVLVSLARIPTARNALLATPYGIDQANELDLWLDENWWRGAVIRSVGARKNKEEGPPVADKTEEIQRLLAFLELSTRSYGTADSLAHSEDTHLPIYSLDIEKELFQTFIDQRMLVGDVALDPYASASLPALTSVVNVFNFQDYQPVTVDRFGLLDVFVPPHPASFYELLDMVFLADMNQAVRDPGLVRTACIADPGAVITCRLANDTDGLPAAITIPETLYIDRYVAKHQDTMRQVQQDMLTVARALERSGLKEKAELVWTNPRTGHSCDIREMLKKALPRCEEKIKTIKRHALWRQREEKHRQGEETPFYSLEADDEEPSLTTEEAEVVNWYESKIKDISADLADKDRFVGEVILPDRESLTSLQTHLSTLLTGPSNDAKWNATHKYTLRAVIDKPNTLFFRQREEVLLEMEGAPEPEDKWFRHSCEAENEWEVRYEPVTYETVMREACGAKCRPILIFATDQALAAQKNPLSERCTEFVKTDNFEFAKELSMEDDTLPTYGQAMVQLPDRKRVGSPDSMASNRGSVVSDQEMPDVQLDEPDGNMMTEAPQEPLVDVSDAAMDAAALLNLSTPPSIRENEMDIDPFMPAPGLKSERLAGESLAADATHGKTPEMQERSGRMSPFLVRPSSRAGEDVDMVT